MIWLKDNKEVEEPKQVDLDGNTSVNPTEAQWIAAGYNRVEPPACDRKYWIIANNTITEMSQQEKDALDTAEAQAAADAQAAQAAMQAARFASLCEQIGGFVQSIRRNLVILGYDLPASSNEIVADITARSLRDELTDEQDRARSRLADVYVILSNKGIGDAEINAVWEAIKP